MEPYRIAACEDDPEAGSQLAALCQTIFASWDMAVQVEVFPSADALGAALETGARPFDLFLLDIQMEGTTGLELARWLYRQGVRDRVIFITGNPEYALAGYDAHPLHYLLKPVSREQLEEALHLALDCRHPQSVLFQRGGKTLSIPVRDIRYLESRDHGTIVHLGDREQVLSIPLADAERMVPAGSFRRCHKSFLVHLAWVREVSRTELLLENGQHLPVSRTFYPALQNALIRYLNHRES